ncbi:MAG: sigma-54 dependent transcriptional regulator [Bacteroidota bacterium]|jgi:DNA-binding NtrC family response regulator|nr:sigma-54 dependent transcriptional regulator [Bacteroidota bacterium]
MSVFDPTELTIMIVDDEPSVRQSLAAWFEDDGYRIVTAQNAAEALQRMQEGQVDIILLDIKMPGMDGLALQDRIREFNTDVVIIIITAFATVDTAVRALKAGAFDYTTKPVDPDELSHLVRNAAERVRLQRENKALRQSIDHLQFVDDIIGESPEMQRVLELVRTVAPTESTVLILGESGTGKELIARAIHMNSRRRYFPIIPVNCGAIPETLLESELFGHEKGAFTGAQYRRKGKFEMAQGGTLFLDEIGTLGLKSQVDLLRVIEDREFHRIGGERLVKADFRLICATNINIEAEVKSGSFREDLYYRINVFTITLPPLRERKADIPLLAQHFIDRHAKAMNRQTPELSSDAMNVLLAHEWPGNVRELENALERALVVNRGDKIDPEDLPMQVGRTAAPARTTGTLADMEREHVLHMLETNSWNISRTAEQLGIDRVTLYNKIEKYGLKRPE